MKTRIRQPFLIAALLAVVASLLYYLWPFGGSDALASDETPTAAQARPAVALASSLPTVPGARRDRYDTACGEPTPYCVWSASLSARQLVAGIERLLRDRHVSAESPTACHTEDADIFGDCIARLRYHGLRMAVFGSDPHTTFGVRRAAFAFVVVSQEVVTPPSRPLPPWRSLKLLPTSWPAPPCKTTVTGGCTRYEGHASIRLPIDQAVSDLRSALASSGLALDAGWCKDYASGRGCVWGGSKFRAVDGQDQVFVTGLLHATAPGVTLVRITVTN